jgi:vacuolar-type H+-ATPase subunit F/Vma7
MSKIALIGDSEFILGFKVLGVKLFPVTTSQEALDMLKSAIDDGDAAIYITEAFACEFLDAIMDLSRQSRASICIIPDKTGSSGFGLERLRRIAARAIGVDILKPH